jgi:hypothetical protein
VARPCDGDFVDHGFAPVELVPEPSGDRASRRVRPETDADATGDERKRATFGTHDLDADRGEKRPHERIGGSIGEDDPRLAQIYGWPNRVAPAGGGGQTDQHERRTGDPGQDTLPLVAAFERHNARTSSRCAALTPHTNPPPRARLSNSEASLHPFRPPHDSRSPHCDGNRNLDRQSKPRVSVTLYIEPRPPVALSGALLDKSTQSDSDEPRAGVR